MAIKYEYIKYAIKAPTARFKAKDQWYEYLHETCKVCRRAVVFANRSYLRTFFISRVPLTFK